MGGRGGGGGRERKCVADLDDISAIVRPKQVKKEGQNTMGRGGRQGRRREGKEDLVTVNKCQ